MRLLLLISVAAAAVAAGILAFQFMPRGGHKAETVTAQPAVPNTVRTIPTTPREAAKPVPSQNAASGNAAPPDVLGDVSRTLGELRTREASDTGAGPSLSATQVEALRAQAERRHVRPVTRMTFPLEPGTIVPAQVYLHPMPPELTALSPADDPLGFIQVGDKFVLVGTVSRRIIAVAKG